MINNGEWANLEQIGKQATKQLCLTLRRVNDPNLRLVIIQTLVKINDPKAIVPIADIYPSKELISTQVEALTRLGRNNVALLGKHLSCEVIDYFRCSGVCGFPYSYLYKIPSAWAICEIGDKKMTETIIKWIFDIGCHLGYYWTDPKTNRNGNPSQYLGQIPIEVLSKLLGSYTQDLLDLFDFGGDSWMALPIGQKYNSSWDISRVNAAIQRLCFINTPFSTNILGEVSRMPDPILAKGSLSVQTSFRSTLPFKEQRQKAKDELVRRGNPQYNSSAYLNPIK